MNLIIFTDGGARGNPGPAGIGVVIQDDKNKTLAEHKQYIGEATNNVAEYKALILALEKATALGAEHLEIKMDSELVVRQMQGRYKIKEPTLQLLAEQVVKLKNNFKLINFKHIRRELNKEADKLVNSAIDAHLGII
jgi:ribonuclease HI